MAFKTAVLLMATVLLVLETSWVSSKNDEETPLLPSMHTSSKVAASKTPRLLPLSGLPAKPWRKGGKKSPPPPPPTSPTSPRRTPPKTPPPPPPPPPADVEPSPDAES